MTKRKSFSVLLLYPQHIAGKYGETYYTWVRAATPTAAVRKARKKLQGVLTDCGYVGQPEDGAEVLLVLRGHVSGLCWEM